ncbi:hypothetical protein QN219_08875 [Sinorhizobium sp. 7-81]|uniref:hypothetical protein n=1 Tax=Sinorhizobium sp. 8-89 TaxID=3049089 RepID=UPI0024C35324|nr:hypothetical protein [Sinorhizobium sp. 8-89]MDK1490171.1 hypothetical protein [Sinorhizobium sp. 8-89]
MLNIASTYCVVTSWLNAEKYKVVCPHPALQKIDHISDAWIASRQNQGIWENVAQDCGCATVANDPLYNIR